jgi:hypothetical protein
MTVRYARRALSLTLAAIISIARSRWRAAREIESGMAPEFTLASGGLQQALREQRCPHPET